MQHVESITLTPHWGDKMRDAYYARQWLHHTGLPLSLATGLLIGCAVVWAIW